MAVSGTSAPTTLRQRATRIVTGWRTGSFVTMSCAGPTFVSGVPQIASTRLVTYSR